MPACRRACSPSSPGRRRRLAEQLIASPIIRKVSLTGSIAVGKSVLKQCAEGVKRVSMELGGHAPVIVHRDADPTASAKAAARGKIPQRRPGLHLADALLRA